MSVLCTGSIAIDQIMVFHDHFRNHILADKIHSINVSFFVPTLEKRFGGTGANIAYNLRVLDVEPILLGTVGSDFGPYADWMDGHGIRRDWIQVLDDTYTAQCFITTDLDNNQINSFHPGAMDRAHEAPISGIEESFGVGIVAPNGKQAMLDHAASLKKKGIPCVIDPGQAMPIFDAEELIGMIEGSSVYVVNDYEWALTLEKTGLDEDGIAELTGAVIVTRGEKGSLVRRGGLQNGVRLDTNRSEIPAVVAEDVVDPTGCGDAYRAGILYAVLNDLPLEIGARMGSLLGSLKVALPGPQAIAHDFDAFRDRFRREFGDDIG
jgi:adenosine kinase